MATSKRTQKLLVAVVDDDESMRDTTKDLLDSAGFRAATFASAEAFLKSPRRAQVSALVADMRMPGMSGLALHQRLASSGSPIPTILITSYPDDAVRKRALEAGVYCYLAKPFAAEELLACVGGAITAGKQDAARGA
jgi:FixJ family two-component response regulator